MFYTIFAILSALPDLAIKTHIESLPEEFFPHPVPGLPLELERHHNFGFAGNRLEEHPRLVRGSAAALYGIFFALIRYIPFPSVSSWEKLGFSLILGGGLSNLADRFTRGYAVDYLHFTRSRLKRIILNLGDIWIFLGSILIGLSAFRQLLSDHKD